MSPSAPKFVDLRKTHKRARQMKLSQKVQKELDEYFTQVIKKHKTHLVNVIKRPGSNGAYVVKLADHFRRNSVKMRNLGDFQWTANYLEIPINSLTNKLGNIERANVSFLLEITVTIRNIDPSYIKTYRFEYIIEDCFKEKKTRFLGKTYEIDFERILEPIKKTEEIERYMLFVMDSYQYK